MTDRPPVADRLATTLGRLLGPDFPPALGLAVSGGGDSMAMLHLVAGWARPMGIALRVVTVDHGLRPESAQEAALVADEARGLGLSHDTLRWEGWDGHGNLMDAARRARLDLIGGARDRPTHVLFAHTEDDVAETFLMRLARGSGIEGLSALAEARHVSAPGGGWTLLRPLLDVSRGELRHHADVLRIPYVDDPSNADPAFSRVRARDALAALAPLGLSATRIAATAARLGSDREVVARRAAEVAEDCDRTAGGAADPLSTGDVWIDRDRFAAVERVTRLRVLSGALQLVASNPYKPRAEAVSDLLDRTDGGATSTLHGCVVAPHGSATYIFREPAAVADLVTQAGSEVPWDRRWQLSGPDISGLEVRSLGWAGKVPASARGLGGLPAGLVASRPSIWDGKDLVAFLPLGLGPPYLQRLESPLAPRTGALAELLVSR